MWLWMLPVMVLVWVLIAVGVVWSVRSLVGDSRTTPSEPQPSAERISAREILDQRYARGEIDDQEYRARRDTLTAR